MISAATGFLQRTANRRVDVKTGGDGKTIQIRSTGRVGCRDAERVKCETRLSDFRRHETSQSAGAASVAPLRIFQQIQSAGLVIVATRPSTRLLRLSVANCRPFLPPKKTGLIQQNQACVRICQDTFCGLLQSIKAAVERIRCSGSSDLRRLAGSNCQWQMPRRCPESNRSL